MSVSINDVVIDAKFIDQFEALISIGLLLRGKAPLEIGRAIYHKLKDYKVGDEVQINDLYKFEYSGSFVIKQIESTIEGPIYKFTLVFGLK